MASNKKPRNKAYRPRWNGDGIKLRAQPWKVELVFRPMYQIIDQLINEGTVDQAPDGAAVFRDPKDGHLYETYSAISGVIGAYEIHECRQGRNLNMEPLRLVINRLHYGMLIDGADVIAARQALDRMRAETLQMTVDYADSLLRDFRISELVEREAA